MSEMIVLGPAGRDRDRLSDLLRAASHNVVYAESIRSCKSVLRQQQVEGIFCFYELEDGNVMDLLSLLDKRNLPTRLVVIAEFADSCLAAEAIAEGAYDYLPTPLDPTEVSACAARLLSGSASGEKSELVRFEARDGILVLHFPPEVVFPTAANLSALVENGLVPPEKGIIFDLEKTRYFSSSGIGVLFLLRNTFSGLSDRLVVSGARPHIRNTMRLAGAEEVFVFVDEQSEAILLLTEKAAASS